MSTSHFDPAAPGRPSASSALGTYRLHGRSRATGPGSRILNHEIPARPLDLGVGSSQGSHTPGAILVTSDIPDIPDVLRHPGPTRLLHTTRPRHLTADRGQGGKPVPSCPRNGSWLLARRRVRQNGHGPSWRQRSVPTFGSAYRSIDDLAWASSSLHILPWPPAVAINSSHTIDNLELVPSCFYTLDSSFFCDLTFFGNSI